MKRRKKKQGKAHHGPAKNTPVITGSSPPASPGWRGTAKMKLMCRAIPRALHTMSSQ